MSKIQVNQCKHCKGYDDELNNEGLCITCEDRVDDIDYDAIEYERYQRMMEEDVYDEREEYDPFLYDGTHLLIEDEDPSCWGDDNEPDDREEHEVDARIILGM